MRRVFVLLAVTSFAVAVYACTDAPSDEVVDEGALSAVSIDGRSVVAVKSSQHARTCPGAVLPGGVVLAARACVASSACAPIDAGTLRVIAGDGAGAQVEAQVSFTLPAPGPQTCSEFVALRLVSPFAATVAPPIKIRVAPVPPATEVDVVTFRGHDAPVVSEAGADADVDAAADAERTSDAAGADADADADSSDASSDADADAALHDAGADAWSDGGAPALDAGDGTSVRRVIRRVAVKQTIQSDGSVLTRRFDVAPHVEGFAVALDRHGNVAGISDGSSVYAEPSTLAGFDHVVRLYESPSGVLDLPAEPVEEASAPSGAVAPIVDPPVAPSAGPEPTRPAGGETSSCAMSPRGSTSTGFAILALAGALLVSRRVRKRPSR